MESSSSAYSSPYPSFADVHMLNIVFVYSKDSIENTEVGATWRPPNDLRRYRHHA
jgi:hypothetical protein